LVYNLPPIHDRLAWRVDNLRVAIKRFLNPPEQVVFIPQEQVDAIVDATLTAMAPTPTQTSVLGPTGTPLPSVTPSPIPTSIPESVALSGIRHEYQKFNNCAPASLSMVLSYWGWTGDQIQARSYLRPNFEVDDKNVSAFEIVDYVKKQTQLDALWRVGGDPQLLKRLLAAGFPVLIEKGLEPHVRDWMGHYQVISGYNDAKGKFLVYDSYEGPPEAYGVPYETIGQWWRHFDFVCGGAGDPRSEQRPTDELPACRGSRIAGDKQSERPRTILCLVQSWHEPGLSPGLCRSRAGVRYRLFSLRGPAGR
jgi:hypothetical protein